MHMWIHPLIQTAALIAALWVFRLGYNRFCFQHLHIRCPFNWKLHVKLGKIVHGLWMSGMALGVYMAWFEWGTINLTGAHYAVGVTMIPLAAVGLLTGLALQTPRGKRGTLALLHGVVNTLLLAMAVYQVWSGYDVIRQFMLS